MKKLILNINAKCSDLFSMTIEREDGDEMLKEPYDGYVPAFMPGQHYGDYVELQIDVETGKILNWRKNADKLVREFIVDNTKDEE